MKGYWREEQGGRAGLRDGWLYTGDIAEMDDEGYFYIRDRKKDLIKYKGYSVAPAEVENVLFEHPDVRECAVVGMPDPVAGEVPKAFVVCLPGRTVEARELIEFCAGRIAPYKRVREVEFIDEIPKNPVGKVLRRLLRDRDSS
jgi:long-chain acyl-CoA synthetase